MMFLLFFLAAEPSSEPASAPAKAHAVTVHEQRAFDLREPRGEMTAKDRAEKASAALTRAIEESSDTLTVETDDDEATFRVGPDIVFILTDADARAEGERSFPRFVERRQSEIAAFVAKERSRVTVQRVVFAITLSVALFFVAFLLLRKVTGLGQSARAWLDDDNTVVTQPMLKKLLADDRLKWVVVAAVYTAQVFLQAALVYAALIGCFSLFETTKPWRQPLTALVLQPFVLIAQRITGGLSTLFLFLFVLIVLRAGVVAIGSFYDRRKSQPSRFLAYVALLLGALLLLTPFVTGDGDHLFTRIGFVLLALCGVASLPLLANVAVGLFASFAQHYRLGEELFIGDIGGKVVAIDSFGVRLEHEGNETRVAHIVTLWRPVRRRAAR
jgi:hypothetical protein